MKTNHVSLPVVCVRFEPNIECIKTLSSEYDVSQNIAKDSAICTRVQAE